MTSEHDQNREDKIREIGLELFSMVEEVPAVFDMKRWSGKLLNWTMNHDNFKIRLFRFIDVLPSLRSAQQVMRLAKEYFADAEDTPRFISRLFRIKLAPAVAAAIVRKSVASIARQFIAGRDPEDAKPAIDALQKDGTQFTIDLLGEVVVSEKEAAEHADRCLALMDFIHDNYVNAGVPDISLKISSLYSQLDPVDWDGSIERTRERLIPLLRRAKQHDISVTFDMEESYNKGLCFAILENLLEEEEFSVLPGAGIALQAYLRDADDDLSKLVTWARNRKRRITVRLVKGAYWDYEHIVNSQKGWPVPVFSEKEETDRNFERLTRRLFENIDVIHPAIATHNIRSISNALAVAEELKIPRGYFEFQLLYGMADAVRKALRARGFAVRVYTPVGELIPGMAYLVRRLLENTSNESFLRKYFSEKTSFIELINAPRVREETRGSAETMSSFENEPHFDFSIEANRRMMAVAIQNIKRNGNHSYPLVIGGREIRTDRDIQSLNPADPREAIGRVCIAGIPEVDRAIEEARKALASWRNIAPHERAGYLFKTSQVMRQRRFELSALEVLEVGKTWKDADADVCEAIDYLEYYGRELIRLAGTKVQGEYPGEYNEYRYIPRGIGVVIAPWNFPLAISTGMTSAAIAAGNAVLYKPSGLSPVLGYKLTETFRLAGLPAGILQFLPGPGSEVGEYLVTHPSIDIIAFTGSKDVGLRIIKLAGETGSGQRNVKRVIAEMGGKNAIIVDESADIDEAVKGIIKSAFGYQGQKCSACSRVISVGDSFPVLCRRLVEAARSLRIGPPEFPGNLLGPVIDDAAAKKIHGYIEIGKKEGKAILEPEASANGPFIGPAIFIDTSPVSRIATEEIFGPVLTIMKAANIDEAITIANESFYALTGGLFSRSPSAIEKVKQEFLVGNLYVNRKITGALVNRQPFGGFGMSGIGSKSGGPDYLLQFMNPMSVSENTLRKGFAPSR